MKRKVLRVAQSTLNRFVWFVMLECGHEVKLVQRCSPRAFTTYHNITRPRLMTCPTCRTLGVRVP